MLERQELTSGLPGTTQHAWFPPATRRPRRPALCVPGPRCSSLRLRSLGAFTRIAARLSISTEHPGRDRCTWSSLDEPPLAPIPATYRAAASPAATQPPWDKAGGSLG